MKKIVLRIELLLLVGILAACASHKKIDYASAYKFDQYDYQKYGQADFIEDPISTEVDQSEGNSYIPKNEQTNASEVNSVTPFSQQSEIIDSDINAVKESYKSLTRKERKQFRKELRSAIQGIQNEEVKESGITVDISKYAQIHDDDSAKKKRRIARYLLIGGGALVIIAVIIGSFAIVGTIGVIAVVAGAVLMILSLDK